MIDKTPVVHMKPMVSQNCGAVQEGTFHAFLLSFFIMCVLPP